MRPRTTDWQEQTNLGKCSQNDLQIKWKSKVNRQPKVRRRENSNDDSKGNYLNSRITSKSRNSNYDTNEVEDNSISYGGSGGKSSCNSNTVLQKAWRITNRQCDGGNAQEVREQELGKSGLKFNGKPERQVINERLARS